VKIQSTTPGTKSRRFTVTVPDRDRIYGSWHIALE
jgi:hypothetical protein